MQIKWICPTAPQQPITLFGGFPSTACKSLCMSRHCYCCGLKKKSDSNQGNKEQGNYENWKLFVLIYLLKHCKSDTGRLGRIWE